MKRTAACLAGLLMLVLLAGLLLCFVCAGRKARAIGRAVFAFGLLFEGIADMALPWNRWRKARCLCTGWVGCGSTHGWGCWRGLA